MIVKKFSLFAIAAVSISAGVLSGPASATRVISGADAAAVNGAPVQDDLTVTGSRVNVDAPVEGDVLAFGQNVSITGRVSRDVLSAGSALDIRAPVGDDLRAAGSQIAVSGPVADNLMLAGSEIILAPSARIGRDAQIAAQRIEINGPVGGNLWLASADAAIASSIRGSVNAHVNHLRLLPGARIHGNLVVFGPNPPEISPQAKIDGRVEYHAQTPRRPGGGDWISGFLSRFLMLLVLGAATLAFTGAWTDNVALTLKDHTGSSLLTGFLGLLLVPIAALILLVTVIGAPLALVLGALLTIGVLLSGIFVSYRAGAWIAQRHPRALRSPYSRIAVGAAIVSLLVSLPYLGGILGLLIVACGVGAVILERRAHLRQPPRP